VHIIPGGDYGYQYRYGRGGTHLFQAWNGELPGTLPMVSETGEAPCGVLHYEGNNLPDEYRGDLLVGGWGSHEVERYKLRPRGASFSAERIPFIKGGLEFRPINIAIAPDGSLYVTDWVKKTSSILTAGSRDRGISIFVKTTAGMKMRKKKSLVGRFKE